MDESRAGALLRDVAVLHGRLQRDAVACCGATSAQCGIVTALGRTGPTTLADLGRTLGLDKGWVSRAVDALADDRLVTKRPGDRDRRTVIVGLSDEGQARRAELDAALDGLSSRVIRRIPQSQRPGVYAALEALRGALLAEGESTVGTAPA